MRILLLGLAILIVQFVSWSISMTDNDSAGRLTVDALHLAISLDSFTTFDWTERIGPAVQYGKQKLTELQRQRDSLIVTRADGAIIDWLLEMINARLVFVERLHASMCRTGPNEKPQPRPGQIPHRTFEQSDGSSSHRETLSVTVRQTAPVSTVMPTRLDYSRSGKGMSVPPGSGLSKRRLG
jgi:hypothetical protein